VRARLSTHAVNVSRPLSWSHGSQTINCRRVRPTIDRPNVIAP
jgi:hypothetical protein